MAPREVSVHLVPGLVEPERLAGGTAVVIDVLRATTTVVHALAAGCAAVHPCATVADAVAERGRLAPGRVILAGERGGLPLPGFDCGNSPAEFTPERCAGARLVLTTSNGTLALLHCRRAARVLAAAFTNLSAVREQLLADARPVHVVCAGDAGRPALEDTLLAGALVAPLAALPDVRLDDSARLALALWEHAPGVEETLWASSGGVRLRELGYDEDIRTAARVDALPLVVASRGDVLVVSREG